jgi:hypothetical protein
MADDETIRQSILTRGHWQIQIKPVEYRKARIDDLGVLAAVVPQHNVALRGWDYPHIDTKAPIARGLDWTGQDTEWEHHLDSWRIYRNGLFVSMNGLREDWRDRSNWLDPPAEGWTPGALLGVGDTIFTLTEVYEFASRLATSPVGAQTVAVAATLVRTKGRVLYVDSPRRRPLDHEYQAVVGEIPLMTTVERTRLVAEAWDIAAIQSRNLFQVFGWDCPLATILDFQRELGEWSNSVPRRASPLRDPGP